MALLALVLVKGMVKRFVHCIMYTKLVHYVCICIYIHIYIYVRTVYVYTTSLNHAYPH